METGRAAEESEAAEAAESSEIAWRGGRIDVSSPTKEERKRERKQKAKVGMTRVAGDRDVTDAAGGGRSGRSSTYFTKGIESGSLTKQTPSIVVD